MWDKSPTLFAKAVEKVAVKHVKTISTDIVGSLADESPVDTTQFTSNHNVSADNPDWSHDPLKLLGDRGSESEGYATINSLPKDKLHDVWFTNATPYGGELEFNFKSSQAPTGVYLPVFLFTTQMYKG